MAKILVVAAHADDEVLGCGGTIARHSAEGDEIHLIFMADGESSRVQYSSDAMQNRLIAAQQAASLLGIKQCHVLGLPDNRMDSLALLDVVQPLEKLIYQIQPEIIYTHHFSDLNVDHQITHKAVMTVCRPQPNFFVKEIYAFEVMSSTEWQTPGFHPFLPNVYIDISSFLTLKKQALNIYQEEMRPLPHSRSIDNLINLAKYRGNSVGVEAAEAFMLLRLLR